MNPRSITFAMRLMVVVTICYSSSSCQIFCLCTLALPENGQANAGIFGAFLDCGSGDDTADHSSLAVPESLGPIEPPPHGQPRTVDCTGPATVGRGDCAGTNRENKPVLYPKGN